MRKMRGQINSQFLVYILAVVIMAIVLIYGYNAIVDMKDRANTVELITFKSDLKTAIKTMAVKYGSTKVESFKVPSGYTEICFVNLEYTDNDPSAMIPATYPIMKNAVADMLTENVEPKNLFLCPKCTEQEYVGNITLQEDGEEVAYRCFDVQQSTIKIRIEGMGDRAVLS